MSGHSKWSTIKHKKAATDAKRGKIFGKLARLIIIAAKDGGDPQVNSKLREAIDYARSFNLPKDNIERAIRKGTGELGGALLEAYVLEIYGPGGIPIICEIITDNKNRTLSEIKTILNKYGGKLAREGSVAWMFDKKGIIIVKGSTSTREELELLAIDAGAEDVRWQDEHTLEIYTKSEELAKTKTALAKQKIEIESATLGWIPKEGTEMNESTKEKLTKLFEELDEQEDIQDIFSNTKD